MRRLARDERGAALIELTLAMPLLISLMVGAAVCGQLLLDYATANKSMRDATRYLARLPAGAVCGWGLTKAQSIAVYGQETVGTALIAGWDPSTVTLATPDCSATPTDPFSVQLRADIPFTNTLLSVLALNTGLTITVTHEEPHIGR
jgi:hypothetical protein